MQEPRRQAYLKALGVTPWVAREPLPGAAASERLDWPEPAPPQPLPQAREAAPAAVEPSRPEPPAAVDEPVLSATARTDSDIWRFTLYALATPTVMLVIQQGQADAPEPSRDEQRMLAGLLRYFQARESRPRPFNWPLPGMERQPEQAGDSLEAFFRHLCSESGCERLLWLVEPQLAERLLGVERYQPMRWGGFPGLAVASLQEMFSRPESAKAESWRAMVMHGFHA